MNSIKCVITDLDDTVWDWFKMWYNSFYPYYTSIKSISNLEDKVLLDNFKKLHQKYHTTEVSFAYKELECLNDSQKEEITKNGKNFKSIIHQYYSNKKRNLEFYTGVKETLKNLKEKGVLIIAFTESNAFFTKYRIKHLGLDGLIDCIYTPLGYGIPESVTSYYEEDYWNPSKTKIRHLSNKDKKPNPEILEIILADYNLNKEDVIYIGDKLDRDIHMAKEAGVTSVFASYGNKVEKNEYQLLVDVTHWTSEEVLREKEFKEKLKNEEIVPDHTIHSYDAIIDLFDFKSY